MSNCPFCGFENIDGVDICEQCHQPLDDLHLPLPATLVEQSLLKDRIAALNPREAITVAAGTPVGEVLQMLVENKHGCAVIVDGKSIEGVFTERDALMKLNAQAAELADRPVSEFMTPKVEALQARNKIAFAVQRMDLGGYRHVPIVDDDDQLTGIVSVRDILRYLTQKITASQSA